MVVWPIAGPKPTPQYGSVANRDDAYFPSLRLSMARSMSSLLRTCDIV
eukprot:CAMPEP_0198681210 /NCGR_PEP_ID=MMETSP1468-20131203/6372_1 /TAXON_ID=1461545 /ORGANISM="Mantoniella sp, Strain CCMP1436" /LENGTH=47 /DNA_ID= /DNA_START= /DNA_END= /DNA_ORIENTATION=